MINNISSNNANSAAVSVAAGQRPPPITRTELPAETPRPVPASESVRTQGSADRVSISQQGRRLAAGGGEGGNTEAGQTERPRNDNTAVQESRGRGASGAEQYRAVLRAVGIS